MSDAAGEDDRRTFVTPEDVESLSFDWGVLKFLNAPDVTGSERFSAGVVKLEPGKGHERHTHPESDEILYVLRGEEHGQGTLDRDVAFATYNEKKAAMNAEHITSAEGTRKLWGDEEAEDPALEREYDRFEPGRVDLDDALIEDLEDLGYA
ncbi:cupin domain-containing protein [Halobium palmae]|uniref:Cupin domain-containing protein n=1 Tax=Halobium palmae TaxID=1776492 RepID=A0ABD5RZL7_9EURY